MTFFIIGLLLGLVIGWTWGTTAEHTLWLDAICGRERISRRKP